MNTQNPEIQLTVFIPPASHPEQSMEESKLLEMAKIQKRIAPMSINSAIDPNRASTSFADSVAMDSMGLDGGQAVQQLPGALSLSFEAQYTVAADSEMRQALTSSSRRAESSDYRLDSMDFGNRLYSAVLQPVHQIAYHTHSQNFPKPTDAQIQDYLLRDTVVQKQFQEKLDAVVAEATRKVRTEELNKQATLQREMERIRGFEIRKIYEKLSAVQQENQELKRMHAETLSQLELERRKVLVSPQADNSNSHLRPLTNLDIAQVLQTDPGSAKLFKTLARKELYRYKEEVRNEYQKLVDDIKRDYDLNIPHGQRNIDVPIPEVGHYVGPQHSLSLSLSLPQPQPQTQQQQNHTPAYHRQPNVPSPPPVHQQVQVAQPIKPPSNEEKAFVYDKLVASGKIADLKADTMQRKMECYDMLVDSKVIRWWVM